MVELNSILQILQEKKVPFVLTGAHGISGWTGKPRNTQDVDILVKAGRNHTRTVNALRTLYPRLEVRNFSASSYDSTEALMPWNNVATLLL